MSHWRTSAATIIRRAIAEGRAQGLDGPELRKFISARYPFGERSMHPYKIWLSELARQLGVKRKPSATEQAKRDAWDKAVGQGHLFAGEKT